MANYTHSLPILNKQQNFSSQGEQTLYALKEENTISYKINKDADIKDAISWDYISLIEEAENFYDKIWKQCKISNRYATKTRSFSN